MDPAPTFRLTEGEIEALRDGKQLWISDSKMGRDGINGQCRISLVDGERPFEVQVRPGDDE